jgi:hypothetical protein
MQIDERFLTVHPRTALWWQQREQCATCRWQREKPQNHEKRNGGGLACDAAPGKGWYGAFSCISARDEGSPCGPDARLWQAKNAEVAA